MPFDYVKNLEFFFKSLPFGSALQEIELGDPTTFHFKTPSGSNAELIVAHLQSVTFKFDYKTRLGYGLDAVTIDPMRALPTVTPTTLRSIILLEGLPLVLGFEDFLAIVNYSDEYEEWELRGEGGTLFSMPGGAMDGFDAV